MRALSIPSLGQVAQLLTARKSFNPAGLIGDAAWNERGLHARRVQLAYWLSRFRRARRKHTLERATRERFDRDGYVMCENFLPEAVFAGLRDGAHTLRTSVRERAEGSSTLRKVPVDAGLLAALPELGLLLEDARFRALLAYGEGHPVPPQAYLQTVTQRPDEARPDPQCSLHRDTFHPTVKAWLYLTDVPESAGPLVYVAGSHRLNAARLAWEHESAVAESRKRSGPRTSSFRIDERELAALGYGPPRRLGVRANTLVVADTFGFHARGVSDGPSMRAEIWAIGRRSPFLAYPLDRGLQALVDNAPPLRWQTRPDVVAIPEPD
jgi:hypothetical protein